MAEIESIYRSHLPAFRRVAAAIAGERELGREAVQEAFATAVQQRDRFRGEAPISAWLWRIVVNTARNARRSRAPGTGARGADSRGSANGALELRQQVQLAISMLPERQRLVLFLRYYADLDYATIARALEISAGTVGATLNAAHGRLRLLLAEVRE